MSQKIPFRLFIAGVLIGHPLSLLWAQEPPQQPRPPRDRGNVEGPQAREAEDQQRPEGERARRRGGRQGGPGLSGPGFGGPGGPGGFGGGPGSQPDIEILDRFDADNNGWLSDEERKEAKTFLESDESPRRNRGGFFGLEAWPGLGGGPPFGPPGPPDGNRNGPPNGPPAGAGQDPPMGPPPGGRGGFGFGGGPGMGRGPGGPGAMREPGKPGKKIEKSEVQPIEGELYDTSLLRTIFIDFGIDHWEAELELFHGTDVDVAATVTVDGKAYPNVGLRFRGASSYFMISRGSKRSLNLSFDMAEKDQRLLGYKTLNLLNCNGDPSMFSSVLYSQVARKYLPAPQANFVRVVVNGENWGIFANVEQFNTDFVTANYGGGKGARWKVSGSPQGRGGLEYFGDEEEPYKQHFELKSKDPAAWQDLIQLCKVLNETPPDELKEALATMLDLDEVLWFLALDNALINSDGYWVRASDYSLYQDEKKVFHLVPHDMNESFRAARGGPGMGGLGRGGRGGLGLGEPGGRPAGDAEAGSENQRSQRRADRTNQERFSREPAPGQQARRAAGPDGQVPDLDPLIGLDNDRMPLRSKLLAVPELRQQYLQNIRTIAAESLTWSELGPVVEQVGQLIEPHVKADTRKLSSYDAFVNSTLSKQSTLRNFIEARSQFLLEYQPKK